MKKIILLFFTLLLAGILISQIKFIPNWINIGAAIVLTIFAFSTLILLFFLIKHWANNYRNKKDLKINDWLKSMFVTVTMVSLAFISFLFSAITYNQGFFGPSLVNTYKFNNTIVYQYEDSCFPPDNACECEEYYSLVYIKNSYFPIMHLIKEVNFYIETINHINNKLYIKASRLCERDINKEIIIELK